MAGTAYDGHVMIKERLDAKALGDRALRTRSRVEIDTAVFQTGLNARKKTLNQTQEYLRITFPETAQRVRQKRDVGRE